MAMINIVIQNFSNYIKNRNPGNTPHISVILQCKKDLKEISCCYAILFKMSKKDEIYIRWYTKYSLGYFPFV